MQTIDVYQEGVYPLVRSFLPLVAGVVFAKFGEFLIANFEQSFVGTQIALTVLNFILTLQSTCPRMVQMLQQPLLTEK
jgi:hypothetical protein